MDEERNEMRVESSPIEALLADILTALSNMDGILTQEEIKEMFMKKYGDCESLLDVFNAGPPTEIIEALNTLAQTLPGAYNNSQSGRNRQDERLSAIGTVLTAVDDSPIIITNTRRRIV